MRSYLNFSHCFVFVCIRQSLDRGLGQDIAEVLKAEMENEGHRGAKKRWHSPTDTSNTLHISVLSAQLRGLRDCLRYSAENIRTSYVPCVRACCCRCGR